MTSDTEQLIAGIWISKLSRFAGMGNKFICQLLEYSGGVIPLYNLNTKIILELLAGSPEKISKASSFLKDNNQRINSMLEGELNSKNGIKVLTLLDESYPEKLKTISSAPAILYISGENHVEIFKKEYCAAIVGTRTPTPYGEAVTRKIVKEIASRGVVIVSGMARGIDSLAHQITLDQNGMTIAVLGCGLDVVYPPENKDLMQKIKNNGLLLSECPPGTQPLKSYFPARNRIISGLSDCVAVMEASKKSGTMITAGYAGDQGRDLFAVPGSIFSPHSSGTNQLIQDGACVLTCAEDMLWNLPLHTIQSLMQPDVEKMVFLDRNKNTNKNINKNTNKNINTNTNKNINTNEPTIQNILSYTEKTMDQIAQDLGMKVSKVSEMLSFMELSGEIICKNGRFSLTESYK